MGVQVKVQYMKSKCKIKEKNKSIDKLCSTKGKIKNAVAFCL